MSLRNNGFLRITPSDGSSRDVELRPGPNRLGADKGNEVPLSGKAVLGLHAVITCVETGSYLARPSERGSDNVNGAVLLNGVNLPLQVSKLLRDGDRLTIGDVELRYYLVAHAARSDRQRVPPPDIARPARPVLPMPKPPRNKQKDLYPDVEKLTYEPSGYLRYLPSCFHQDDLMNNLLLAFEGVLGPIEQRVDQLAWYFEPWLTTAPLLDWLAGWLGLAPDTAVEPARRRALVAKAIELYRWRGTACGLKTAIKLTTGLDARIVNANDDPRLPANTFWVVLPNAPGEHERIVNANDEPRPPANTFWVVLLNAPGEHVQMLRRLIEHEKPAHASYKIRYPRAADPTTEATP